MVISFMIVVPSGWSAFGRASYGRLPSIDDPDFDKPFKKSFRPPSYRQPHRGTTRSSISLLTGNISHSFRGIDLRFAKSDVDTKGRSRHAADLTTPQ
ncbi:hypothetical protein [Ensifer sp. 4252]|uniref:hypothetical protein n=1 Tax=Ensifer sp. 4252 TaxID=3373915 RepID=UPI003D200F08